MKSWQCECCKEWMDLSIKECVICAAKPTAESILLKLVEALEFKHKAMDDRTIRGEKFSDLCDEYDRRYPAAWAAALEWKKQNG